MSAVVFFAVRRGWPTPNHCRKAADALDALSPARYGDILRAYADAEDARTTQRRPPEMESLIANVLDEAWPEHGGRWAICQALARRVAELLNAEREGIADAIAAREAEYHGSPFDPYSEGRRDAYDDAESIVWGES